MEICTATLAHFKRSHKHWTAFLTGSRTKVTLPLCDLKVLEGETMRDLGPCESRPKLEQKKTVVLQLEAIEPEPKIIGWALAPA